MGIAQSWVVILIDKYSPSEKQKFMVIGNINF